MICIKTDTNSTKSTTRKWPPIPTKNTFVQVPEQDSEIY
jgi:hypothetical protein